MLLSDDDSIQATAVISAPTDPGLALGRWSALKHNVYQLHETLAQQPEPEGSAA